MLKETANARMFLELLRIFNLEQHVNVPTNNNNHILDLIITRKEDAVINNLTKPPNFIWI